MLAVVPLGGLVLAFLLAVGGFTFAASKEAHDGFCSSCHSQPESTFYQRSLEMKAVDLASAHKPKDTRCIDCHSGPGLFGRINAELMGARNAFAWVTRTAVQPAPQTVPVGDWNCLKCHQDITVTESMQNHFHVFLARWQSVDPSAGTCVSCHTSHTTDGTAEDQFLNIPRTQTVCQACHSAIGERGG